MVGFCLLGVFFLFVLFFVVWGCVEWLYQIGVLGKFGVVLFKDEFIASYEEAVRVGDIALQDQLEALARDCNIELS